MQISWQQAVGIDESALVGATDGRGREFLLHRQAIEDWQALSLAAQSAGVAIAVISSYRSFAQQLNIWNEKWRGHRPVFSRHGRPLNVSAMSNMEKYKAISVWSAMPGMSRHHWGSDLDIFALAPIEKGYQVQLTPEEFEPGGPSHALNDWLGENLQRYGFFRPYREFRGGVSIEPWHISHRATSELFERNFDFEACRQHLVSSDISQPLFIQDQLAHYRDQYFKNICHPTSGS